MIYLWTLPIIFLFRNVLMQQANVCDSIFYYNFKNSRHCWYNPDVHHNTKEILLDHGFSLAEYLIHTKDGYILTVYRIPHSRKNNVIGKPVFIQHGAASSSDSVVIAGEKSLAFILSNLGFDVWLGNIRSSLHSSNHETISAKDKKYWNFTLEEMGTYDLPAVIEKIATVTQKPGEIMYIGHSQGTTIALIYSILQSEHAAKYLKGLYLLAPVAYLTNLPILGINIGFNLTNTLWENDWYYIGFPRQKHLTNICSTNANSVKLCSRVMDWLLGPSNEYAAEQYPLVFSLTLQIESIFPLKHFIQIARSGNFAPYNYGPDENLRRYGRIVPPNYEFGKIKLPVFLFSGENDFLAPAHNVERLYNELKAASSYPVHHKVIRGRNGGKYNHANFLFAKTLEESLVQPLLNTLEDST